MMAAMTRRSISEILPVYMLPLDLDQWHELQDAVLRERERCVGCGEDGVYWYAHGWVCEECDE